MNNDGMTLFLKIVSFAGILVLLYFFFRRKKVTSPTVDPALEAKIQELRIQGMSEEDAKKQGLQEYQAAARARQKKVSIIMGAVWMAFGIMFTFINGLDVSSIALMGLGVIQIVMGLMIKN